MITAAMYDNCSHVSDVPLSASVVIIQVFYFVALMISAWTTSLWAGKVIYALLSLEIALWSCDYLPPIYL